MTLNLLDSIFGALLSGVIVNSWIFGLVCVLSYQYFRNFPLDGKGTKILVIWMLALQAFNAIVVSKMIYFYLINSFGNTKVLANSNWEFALFHGLSAIAAFFVQVYNARRIFVLTKQYTAVAIIASIQRISVLFAFVSVAFALAFMAEIYVIVTIDDLHSVSWVAIVWLSLSMACDLVITAFQAIYLHKHRTGIDKTNRIINILILYIMSTGLLTSISVIAELITFSIFGWNYVHVFISVPLGGVYTISFLANLDVRRRVREIPGPSAFKFGGTHTESGGISIEIKRTRQILSDRNPEARFGPMDEVLRLEHKDSGTLSSKLQSGGSEHTVLDDEEAASYTSAV